MSVSRREVVFIPDGDVLDVPDDEYRYASKRKSYLKRVLGTTDRYAEVIAWAELGYSNSGISKKLDIDSDTVKNYMDNIEDEFGIEVLLTRTDDFGIYDEPKGV